MILCECEKSLQSVYSPCIVACSEILTRLIYAPELVNKQTGEIKPTAFQSSHFKSGVSINRNSFVDQEIFERKSSEIAQKSPSREIVGGITGKCSDIRALMIGELRAICVVDDGEENDISHALLLDENGHNKADFVRERNRLWSIFDKEVKSLGSILDLRL